MIEANGVELCTEAFGDPRDPPILLIMGIGASMLWWEEGFCRMLADGGRFVIRYDHRDTGRSVTYEPGRPEYTGADLVADAAGVLDAYEHRGRPRRRRLGGRGVRAAARARCPGSRPLARPDQHLSRRAGRARAPAADRGVRAVRVDGTGGLVGRRVGDRVPGRLLARARRRASARSTRPQLETSSVATSSAPATSRRFRTTTCSRTTGASAAAVVDRGAHPRHPRHRGPDVPDRARRGARGGDPGREAAAAGGSRPRGRPGRLGNRSSERSSSTRRSAKLHLEEPGLRRRAITTRP